jgi:hypothetical protein
MTLDGAPPYVRLVVKDTAAPLDGTWDQAFRGRPFNCAAVETKLSLVSCSSATSSARGSSRFTTNAENSGKQLRAGNCS